MSVAPWLGGQDEEVEAKFMGTSKKRGEGGGCGSNVRRRRALLGGGESEPEEGEKARERVRGSRGNAWHPQGDGETGREAGGGRRVPARGEHTPSCLLAGG